MGGPCSSPSTRIDHLFCRPDVAGTGVTAALYAALEAAARARGIGLVYVEASEPARRFFAKQGFHLIGRHDFEISGVAIHNFEMEKRIGSNRKSD
jgi:putative acetyltransferase